MDDPLVEQFRMVSRLAVSMPHRQRRDRQNPEHWARILVEYAVGCRCRLTIYKVEIYGIFLLLPNFPLYYGIARRDWMNEPYLMQEFEAGEEVDCIVVGYHDKQVLLSTRTADLRSL